MARLIVVTGVEDGRGMYINADEIIAIQPLVDLERDTVVGSRVTFRVLESAHGDLLVANCKEDPVAVANKMSPVMQPR